MPPVTVSAPARFSSPSSRACTAPRGEAAVQIDVLDGLQGDTAELGEALAADAERPTARQLGAMAERDHRVGLHGCEWEDPTVTWDVVPLGGFHRAEQDRRGLVDVPLRAVQLGVRRGEHRIAR